MDDEYKKMKKRQKMKLKKDQETKKKIIQDLMQPKQKEIEQKFDLIRRIRKFG
jgi:hypothetical protein